MRPALTSWKEIAQYLGKGVRTVQRWEQEFGLPVRRARGGDKRAILAIPEELDAWIRSQRVDHPVSLKFLQHENAALRAENAALKLQLAQSAARHRSDSSSFDYDLLIRSSKLILETTKLKEHTDQLLVRLQASRRHESLWSAAEATFPVVRDKSRSIA